MNINIYRELKNRILFLEYKPAQILNEKTLAEEFGVSRTPLREVLNRLEWDQLVRVLPRSGTMVTEIEFQKMMYTYQVRFEIEDLVGKLALEHMTGEHIAQIEALEQKCLQLANRRARRELVDIDIEFRGILFDAAHNPVLTDISNHLYNLTLRLWYTTLERGNWSEEVQAMCDEIVATKIAWKNNNPKEVGLMRRETLIRHFERIREKFLGMPPLQ